MAMLVEGKPQQPEQVQPLPFKVNLTLTDWDSKPVKPGDEVEREAYDGRETVTLTDRIEIDPFGYFVIVATTCSGSKVSLRMYLRPYTNGERRWRLEARKVEVQP